MLTIEELKAALVDRRLDIVSEATGVHRSTIARIRDGQQQNPTYYIMRKLSDYLTGKTLG
jgi:predicted transcriptional regulator